MLLKPLVLTITGGGKSIKKDLTIKEAMIMAGKKAKVVTVDQLQQAVALIARVEAVSDLTIDQVYSNMSVEQLEELKMSSRMAKHTWTTSSSKRTCTRWKGR